MTPEEIIEYYEDLAKKIPESWFEEEELEKSSNPMFEHLQKSLDVTVLEAAKKSGQTEEDFLDALKETSRIFGKITLFKAKYPEIVNKFPKNLKGDGIFPTNILAIILCVSDDDAIEIARLYFGETAEVKI